MIQFKVLKDSDLFYEEVLNEGTTLIVGRGSSSSIVLDAFPGISREHFKISIQSGFKIEIKLLSKTGKLIHNGQNIESLDLCSGEQTVSIPPYDFIFTFSDECQQHPHPNDHESSVEHLAQNEENIELDSAIEDNSSVELMGNENQHNSENSIVVSNPFDEDEKTKTAISSPLEYSMKVFKGDRLLQELALEGSIWDFGRDQDCHYTIKSKKTSRKHFTITSNRSKFYVKDLGSSNGTFLNSQQLPVNQEIELKSGDYIEVTDFKFIFEIKDNSFEEKIKGVALIEEFDSHSDLDELNNLRGQALSLGDEFLKLPEKDRPSAIAQNQNTKKYLRPALIGLLVIIGGFYFTQGTSSNMSAEELAALKEQKRLIQERKNAAIDKFNLALRFYNESQFERCIFEIDEFLTYDIQTEETAGAVELKNQCDIEKDRLQRKRDLEIQEQKRFAIEKKVKNIVDLCSSVAPEGTQALKPCIEPAYSLDPSNEDIAKLLDLAQAADLKREQEEAAAKAYQSRVSAGKSLFKKATEYDRYGDWKRALKTYKKFINSKYPDPNRLKKKAQRSIASINTRIDGVLSSALKNTKYYLAETDYKNAVLSANKGLDVNRDQQELLSLRSKAQKSLKIILRKYYQESIIQEDFGQTDEAKILWKKILDQGVQGSDYYEKAKSKLRYYEEGV